MISNREEGEGKREEGASLWLELGSRALEHCLMGYGLWALGYIYKITILHRC
jgi:hypothetical protein